MDESSRILAIDVADLGESRVAIPLRWSGRYRVGQQIWMSAFVLLSAIVEGLFEVNDRSVLELGTGAHGFVSRMLVKWWPSCTVIATEGDPETLTALRDVSANERCAVEALDWRDSQSAALLVGPDLLLGADVIYDTALAEPLADSVAVLLRGGGEAWLCVQERNPSAVWQFLRALDTRHLLHQEIACSASIWTRAQSWLRRLDEEQPPASQDVFFQARAASQRQLRFIHVVSSHGVKRKEIPAPKPRFVFPFDLSDPQS